MLQIAFWFFSAAAAAAAINDDVASKAAIKLWMSIYRMISITFQMKNSAMNQFSIGMFVE
jgi:hypothetical protein